MCQPKSKGGKRCAHHLSVAANAALVASTAAQTGLSRAEVADAWVALEAEGANVQDPTREQVDEFLEQQAFRARFDPALSEAKRESIVSRLRAAIGRILPSGRTWHAMKSVLGEAWARSRRKVVAIFMAGAVSFGVGACGSASTASPTPSVSSPSVSAPANPTADAPAGDRVEEATVSPATINPEAVTAFGEDRARGGYDQAMALAQANSFNETLLTSQDYAALRDNAPLQNMTPSMQAQYLAQIDRAEQGDEQADQALQVFSYNQITSQTVTFPSSGPLITNRTVSAGDITVNRSTGADRLAVRFTEQGTLHMEQSGAPVQYVMGKNATYYFAPAPDGSGWLLDGYEGEYTVNTA